MNPLDLLALLGIVCTPLSLVLGVSLWNARKELQLRRELTRDVRDRAGDRMGAVDNGQLAQAMDAIAIEVERIAEGQRFVTKLLAERSAAERAAAERPALPAPPRVVTPH